MVKSELIALIAKKYTVLSSADIELAVNQLLHYMSQQLSQGVRIELRDFGCFCLHHQPPRQAHNPKTGEKVTTFGKYKPHFKAGKGLRDRVNRQYGQPLTGHEEESLDPE